MELLKKIFHRHTSDGKYHGERNYYSLVFGHISYEVCHCTKCGKVYEGKEIKNNGK